MQESQTKNTTKKFRILFCFVLFSFETEATTTTQNSQSLTSKGPTFLKALSCLKTAVER
jgi:hypothetical protein